MADQAAPAPALTLDQKKAAARERARAAREQQATGAGAGLAVTDAAAGYVRESADREGMDHGVRLRIHAGGCSGLEYSIDLIPRGAMPAPDERQIESNGIRVLLDLKSAIYVSGSVVDYTTTLMRRGFVIKNPNATSTCSCGDRIGD
jgi:iron-sulfur cluster assembly protein